MVVYNLGLLLLLLGVVLRRRHPGTSSRAYEPIANVLSPPSTTINSVHRFDRSAFTPRPARFKMAALLFHDMRLSPFRFCLWQ